MRICFVTTNFPRYKGDSEGTFVFEATKAIVAQGNQIRVIAQHWPGYPTYERMDNVEVIRLRYWWPEQKEVLRQPGGGLPIVWKKSWLARLQMLPFLVVHTLSVMWYARGYDIIHAQWTLSAGVAWVSKIVHHCPIVVTVHGSDVFQVTRNVIGAFITRKVLMGCNAIIAVSSALKDEVKKLGVNWKIIEVIPDGIDTEKFTVSSCNREPVLLYVGSLIKRKGVNYLIDALSQLVEKNPSYKLVIIGDGSERTALERQVTQLKLEKWVQFTGSLPQEEVRNWMQIAKIFVLPSVEEGLGVVLLESLACGTPIVASNVGGIPDVVVSEVGILVPVADPVFLAEALDKMINDEHLWLEMSANARRRAEEKYDWSKIARQLIISYERILNN